MPNLVSQNKAILKKSRSLFSLERQSCCELSLCLMAHISQQENIPQALCGDSPNWPGSKKAAGYVGKSLSGVTFVTRIWSTANSLNSSDLDGFMK